jgi:NAD(P)H-hydrate epimerase
MRILTRDQIRNIDRLSTEEFGIPGLLLMENAGMRVVEAIEARVDDLDACAVVILAGKGNNGGDGFVVARQLIQRGFIPETFLFALPEDVSGDARINLDILSAIGHPPTAVADVAQWEQVGDVLLSADIIVDALLGTGVSRPAEGLIAQVIGDVNDAASAAWIVSVDVPSGSRADRADLDGPVVEADLTVTLTALKHCLVFEPAGSVAGEVVVADIGNPHQLTDAVTPRIELIDPELFPEAIPSRDDESQKGDYGKVLVIGGSEGKAGAPAMTARAVLQCGGGLVTVAVPAPILSTVAAFMPEVMTAGLRATPEGAIGEGNAARVQGLLADKTVVAMGPGLGTSQETVKLVGEVVREATVPLVLDADGINAFAGNLPGLRNRTSGAPLVITPHPGEMARLVGRDIPEILRNRLEVARHYSQELGVYLVLKGFRTVVACPDGTAYVNPTGNAGMATAGAGDILTGMLAGMIGQAHLGPFSERLCLAVYLHGLAGDLGAEELGEEPLVATDILRFLPAAWRRLRDR